MYKRQLLDHLNLATLKLVAAIEHEGSLSRAAATLHIVPSAASRRITQLETAMGVELLHRTARGAGLTAAGLSIARYARAMMEDVDTLDAELQNLQAGVSGRIQLVASISAIVQHLPQDLALFLQQHPGIKIELAEHTSAEIVELLLPLVQREDKAFAEKTQNNFKVVFDTLKKYRKPDGSFETYSKLSERDRKMLAGRVNTLAEDCLLYTSPSPRD